MDPALWTEVKAALELALDLPSDQRTAFLDQRLPRGSAARREADRLLAVNGAGIDLEPPTPATMAAAGIPAPRLLATAPGTRIGSYTIVRALGAGGMGDVYEAVQTSPRRTVALKVMRTGLGTADAVRRFQYESELLARLRHPGIAQVFESGIARDDGVEAPWFTMELLAGASPILAYARRHELAVDARIALFLQACEAVHYGHQRGVIHRDLKPANLLVEATGRLKVIDFGIARATEAGNEPSLALTRAGDLLGTLHYMSPEQVSGHARQLDVRSDVYSMGIVLYELLSGVAPYQLTDKSLTEIGRIICEQEPLRPSTRASAVPGELDWVVLKAIAKEPGQRYGTVEELAQDLRRYRDHQPVAARPPAATYYLRKFARRHRVAAVGAAVVLVTLLAGVIATVLQKQRADAAVSEFDRLANVERLRLARVEEAALYPAWPDKIAAMQQWLGQRVQPLLEALPELHATVEQLRARAVSPSVAELEAQRRRHPRYGEIEPLRQKIDALRRAQAVQSGAVAFEPFQLDPASLPEDAESLVYMAWSRVAIPRQLYGQEAEGLALARLAVARCDAQTRQHAFEMLGWALVANGLDAEAVPARRGVFEGMPTDARQRQEAAVSDFERTIENRAEQRRTEIAQAEQQIEVVQAELAEYRNWRFASDADQFLHDTLVELVGEIDAFAEREVRGVEQRLFWAEQLRARQDHDARCWAQARAAVRAADGVVASALYAEQPIELLPQVGLVPIGMNPVTRLWEFYHLRSAADPDSLPQHAADGSIEVTETTGIVFVLIPGGRFTMGAQSRDPRGANHDADARPVEGPVRPVTLAPFFLARHEMTQGQWQRLSGGQEPSWYRAGRLFEGHPSRFTLAHPVEQVSWHQCTEQLAKDGLVLPTEAQWEFACRAGTRTPWSSDVDAATLSRIANVADLTMSRTAMRRPADKRVEDGWSFSAPVGTFAANDFGLYDMHGNVYEWCRDWQWRYLVDVRDGDGQRELPGTEPLRRVLRGGSFGDLPIESRAAARSCNLPDVRTAFVGVRAARSLDARD